MKYAVAIDIGGTNTRVALIDENYVIEQRIQFPTDAQDPYVTMNQIKEAIDGFNKDIELTHSNECGLFFIKPSSLLFLILS